MPVAPEIKALLKRFDQPVPRYTSYPTAPHFHEGVDETVYRSWLEELPANEPLSLYFHIPFCDTLCWFCGCNTKITQKYEPVSEYLGDLLKEISLMVDILGQGRPVSHIHWGGGSPTLLTPDDMHRLGKAISDNFKFTPDAEFAVEIDPREVTEDQVAALAAIGVNRASIGMQDINPIVQRAINRIQPMDVNRAMVTLLRKHGIHALNLDLMYGLPFQTEGHMRSSVTEALTLKPSRIALFGYAHVPWMKTHMKLIKDQTLPGPDLRFIQAETAAEELEKAGYVRIGLDHFAHPDDPMAKALAEGTLHRNFQGYTVDPSAALIGFGASAIGALPQGYLQNHTAVHNYREDIEVGRLPIAKGIALDEDDRMRREVIGELMCHMRADLGEIASRYGQNAACFVEEIEALEGFKEAGLIAIKGNTITLTETGRIFMRPVAAAFDAFLGKKKGEGQGRHSIAV